MTNKEKYKKAFDVLASSAKLSLEVTDMKKKKNNNMYRKIAAAAAVVVFLGMSGIGAYAAIQHWGILDFAGEEIPGEAIEQIQTDMEVVQEENDTIFNCKVKEALCDSQSIRLVYGVSAKEKGKYLFVPEDAMPEDLMINWSDVQGKTAREYADEKGLTIVNIGGGIRNMEELGIAAASLQFVSVSDDEMDIYVFCQKEAEGQTMNVEAVAVGRPADSEDVMRLNSVFELQDLSTTTSDTYLAMAEAESDFFAIKEAEVLQTELGTYVDIYYTNEKTTDEDNGLTFRIVDSNGKEYGAMGGSGVESVGTNYRQRCLLNKCEIGDTLYVEAFDCYEKTVYGVTQLGRTEK